MTDPSQMSDAELLAAVAMPALTHQESGGNGMAVSSQGALGSTQMLPATAQAMADRLGVPFRPELLQSKTPEAIDYQQNLGRAYLQQGIEQTGNLKDGLHYYHGGPDRHQWGPKTAAYADSVMGAVGGDPGAPAPAQEAPDPSKMSDADLMAALGQAAPAQPSVEVEVLGHPELGRGAYYEPGKGIPKPPLRPQPLPQLAKAAPPADPTIAQDAVSGAWAPFQTLGHDLMDGYRGVAAGKSLDPLFTPRVAGDVLGLAGAPVQAVIRPLARGINRYLPAPSEFTWDPTSPFRKLSGDEAQAHTEGALNTALSAAMPETPRAAPAVAPKTMSLDELRAAKSAAYDAADQLGVAYAPSAQAKLADDIGYDLAAKRINSKVTPKAHAMMEDVQTELRSGKPLTMTDMDQLRQSVERATGKADDAEKFFGGHIKAAIDNFIDNAGPAETLNGNAGDGAQALAAARDLNSRYRKVQEVTNRTESADLRASSTYAGGNRANATRQNLRPLIDPKSNQRIRNLTPDEARALSQVVRGTPAQNAMRVAGKVLDPRGLLGAAVQTTMGLPTHGLSTVTAPLGMAASGASNAMTASAVQRLIDMMSAGPKAPPIPPKIPMLTLAGRPALPIWSPAGLVGASEVAAPLARIPSASVDQRSGQRGR